MHIKTIDSLYFPHWEVLQAVFTLVPHRLAPSFTGAQKLSPPSFTEEHRVLIILHKQNKQEYGLFLCETQLSCNSWGINFVNSLHAYIFASLKRKKLISTTPLNDALNALILALNASAAAFVLLFTKKFKILS